MSSQQGPEIDLDGRHVINLSSNDYLGLTHHPRMKEAALRAVREYGAGTGAVRSIIGTMSIHEELEAELAAFKHTEAVLTFQSGFTCNTGVIPAVTAEQDLILSDSLNHASIIDGMRLSKAPRKVFPHKDVAALRELLREAAREGPRGRLGAVPAHPDRHRRRVLDGRRHRAAARDRRGGRGVRQRRGVRGRRALVGRPRARTAAAASTTSASTGASRSRSARSPRRSACSAATSRARRRCATS